uniref:Putative insulin-like growth factor-binding protein complex acid labile subunit agrilus planipennis n=1 Tax=Xenopsylla cheopis TaxID=163159 RepID=A0A6M2DRJ4_XENCH
MFNRAYYNGHFTCKLIFENSNIEHVMQGIFDIEDNYNKHLLYLYLSNTNLESIETGALKALERLLELKLDNNKIQIIQMGALKGLQNLILLDISHNQLSGSLDYRNFTGVGQNLTNLDLSFNNIDFIREHCFKPFINLIHLNVSQNNLLLLPSLYNNIKLSTIILSHNHISMINEVFPEIDTIDTIDLSFNNFTSSPKDLEKYQSISNLNLEYNYLMDISDLMKSVKFNTLLIKGNNIKKIIGGTFCSELVVSSLNLTELNNINMCENGTFLDASHNHLKSFPKWSGMKAIKKIYLQNNEIKEIPYKMFHDMNSLIDLRLDKNKISNLNFGVFFGLNHLKSLNLSFNELTTIDHNVLFELQNLEDLYLGGNKLTTIPSHDIFATLKHLKRVGLSRNHWTCPSLMDVLQNMRKNNIELVHHGEIDAHVVNLGGIRCWIENITVEHNSPTTDKYDLDITTSIQQTDTTMTTSTPKTESSTQQILQINDNNITEGPKTDVETNVTQGPNTNSTQEIKLKELDQIIAHAEKLLQERPANLPKANEDQLNELLVKNLRPVQSGIYETNNLFIIIIILFCCYLCIELYKFYNRHMSKMRSYKVASSDSQRPLANDIEL